MIAWRSIEIRLTAWYTFLLFVGFALFSFALWLGVRYGVRVSVDARLTERLERLEDFVEAEADGDAPAFLEEELVEFLFAVPEGRLVRARDASGRRVFPRRAVAADPIPWRAADAGPIFFTVTVDGVSYRALRADVTLLSVPYEFLMLSSLETVVWLRDRLAVWLLLATPFALVVCGVSGLSIARRALRPVDNIAELAASVSVGSLSRRIPFEPTGDSLERLSRTFNAMLERLESSVRRIEQFSADASHELRTPVSVIRTTAELALRHGRTHEEHESDLRDIHTEAEHLTELIDVLLTLSRHGDSRAIAMAPVDVAELVTGVCRLFRARAHAKALGLEVKVPHDLVVVNGNEASLRRLIASLIENALAHTSAGAIRVAIFDEPEGVRVTVEDTGEGIPEESLDRIFDRLYRVDSARSGSRRRFGMGLTIARRIAAVHDATLTVSSRVGEGSVFTIQFPRSDPPPPSPESTTERKSWTHEAEAR